MTIIYLLKALRNEDTFDLNDFVLQAHLKAAQAETLPKLLKELAKRKSCT